MTIEVVLALADRQWVVYIPSSSPVSASQAWLESGLSIKHQKKVQFAVSGVQVDDSYQLQSGDRLEVVRPLQIDPKELRRMRARHQAKK